MGKRKAAAMEEGEENGGANLTKVVNPEKRLRSGKQRQLGNPPGAASEVLLEEMGVQLLSHSSASNSPVTVSSKQNVGLVLQPKDPNIIGNTTSGTDTTGQCRGPGAAGDTMWDHSLNVSYLPVGGSDGNSSYLLPSETPDRDRNPTSQYSIPLDLSLTETDTFSISRPVAMRRSGRGKDLLNTMSEEVILGVFRWLPKSTLARCARVCKRWLRLTADETLWKRLDLGLAKVTPGVVGKVVSRGCQVLRLARATVMSPIFVSPLTGQATFPLPGQDPVSAKLQYLDLSFTIVDPSCLATLLSTCRQLRKLALENCELDGASVEAIAANSGLKVLHLGGTTGLTPPRLTTVLKGCRQLQELNLGWTGLCEAGVRAVVEGLSSTLERFCFSGHRDSLLDSHMAVLGERCPNLKELDISDATKLTSQTLTVVVDKLLILESLSTSRCYSIPPSSYLYLSSCSSLLYLNVFGVLREQAMEELGTRLTGLELNKFMFTSVARPTVGIKRTSIWNLRVRD